MCFLPKNKRQTLPYSVKASFAHKYRGNMGQPLPDTHKPKLSDRQLLTCTQCRRFKPGMLSQALGLESTDHIGCLQRLRDLVQAIKQTMLPEGIDIERQFAIIRRDDH